MVTPSTSPLLSHLLLVALDYEMVDQFLCIIQQLINETSAKQLKEVKYRVR
jgi:hypothetical protein